MSKTDLNPLDPKHALKVNESPMQIPGQPVLLRSAVVGGPETPGDRRIYLASGLLAQLLEIARSSTMGRVQVDRAGVRVDLYRTPHGHEYEVWTLIGADPRPERTPEFIAAASAERG